MSSTTERKGVAFLMKFFADAGWLFREQFVHDWGIDAHVEIVRGERPTGELIALQVKSGSSYFSEQDEEEVIFRSDEKHIRYWVEHSMPVVVVLYNPDSDQAFWAHISEQSAVATGKGWKVAVPKVQSLSDQKRTIGLMSKLLQPEPYIRRLNKLRLDMPWMEKLDQGLVVTVQFDAWVNKSLPRFQLELRCGKEAFSYPVTYMPGVDVEAMLEFFLPWADFELDHEAHRDGSESQWEAECYQGRDPENGHAFYGETFDSWYKKPTSDIVPVSRDGEVETYKLLLSLNELGEAFLIADEFLQARTDHEPPMFTIDEVLGG